MSVHPRVCGEQKPVAITASAGSGSSPRVRGTENGHLIDQRGQRFIPACAGNSTLSDSQIGLKAVHPRVCGEQIAATPAR